MCTGNKHLMLEHYSLWLKTNMISMTIHQQVYY